MLATAAVHTDGAIHPTLVGEDASADAGLRTPWIGMDQVLADPTQLLELVRAAGRRRFASDDTNLVLAQVAREAIAVLAEVAVGLWARQRRLLDVSAAHVALAEGDEWVVAGLRRISLSVLADDPLAVRPDVSVVDEDTMFGQLLSGVFGAALPAGAMPAGPPDQVPAIATMIAATRAVIRSGERHLWGTAALGASSALTTVSHDLGKSADLDRERLFQARPDLARTLTLVTVDPDGRPVTKPVLDDDTITFAVRKTCCLLTKLPVDEQCGTCSLRDEAACIKTLTDWYVEERRQSR